MFRFLLTFRTRHDKVHNQKAMFLIDNSKLISNTRFQPAKRI